MQAKDFMSEPTICCSPQTTLRELAQLMGDYDCGAIPVFENDQGGRIAGIVTDRDVALRAVAEGLDPNQTTAGEIMSTPVYTVTPETSEQELCQLMEQYQVRRVPVIDESNQCCGMVSQADIARLAPEYETAEVVRDISQPAAMPGL